jgi:polyisoprenyl-phosphate glycosyltransferase
LSENIENLDGQHRQLAVVVPVYCEAGNIPKLYAALIAVVSRLTQFEWQFVFVNDGSSDASWDSIAGLVKADSRVSGIDLSRNFGKEIALTAGVHACKQADAVICMDADLQHPPELIPELIREWQAGAEIVVTLRRSIERQPLLRRIGSHGYYWLMSKLSGLDMRTQTTDFRLYDKKVVVAFCQATERQRMFRGIMDWLGFRKTYVPFDAGPRESGQVGYSYAKLWRLAIDSITSFSLFPLKVTGYLGVVIAGFSGVMLFWMMLSKFLLGSTFFSPLSIVVMANTFLMGIVLMAVGMVALYIGQIHTEVINRPLYVVRETIGPKS